MEAEQQIRIMEEELNQRDEVVKKLIHAEEYIFKLEQDMKEIENTNEMQKKIRVLKEEN